MSILDFLKRKKEIDRSRKNISAKVLDAKKSEKIKIITSPEKFSEKSKKKFSYDIIREPHVSEKASILGESNTYIFKVQAGVGKKEIKKSVEGIYGIDVLSVNTIRVPRKKRRIGRTEGFKKGYAKAMVKIKEGQKIEIL